MKAKKRLYALRVAITTMMLALLGLFATACGDKGNTKNWPETGVYCCYDVGDEETALALSDGKKFVFTADGETLSGTYKLTDLSLVLTFGDKSTVTAAYNDTVINMTYQDVAMTFYKVVPYTVTYDAAGGSTVAESTVTNGKTLEKPANPTRGGYEFIGWYTDSAYKAPFLFGTQKVTGDTTLHARWAVSDPDAAEFTVDFDLGYNAENPASVSTIDGKVYNVNVPTPARNGYTFAGWAVSMFDDGEKLSYMFKDGMSLSENVTFFAVWAAGSNKLATPAVSVEAGAVTWTAVAGVSTYKVEITGPDGFTAINTTTGATTFNVEFGDSPAGEYVVKVTATASDSSKNSETAVRYYINKALARVSHFSVNGSVVSFNAVENATNYLLTVDCGDKNHNHTNVDLGTETSYDFKNCLMQEGGVTFTVTSTAEGYSSVTSRTFAFVKDLDGVTGLSIDEATGLLSWSAVENAEKYVVSVKCGNAAHAHEKVYVSGTQYSLKECENSDGGIVVNVYAIADGYNASPVANTVYNKTALATPSVVLIDGTLMKWAAVKNATGYNVKIGDRTFAVTTNSIELSEQQIDWVKESDYTIALQATGANGATSLWSDDIDVRYYAMYTSLAYKDGVVSWNHVVGAMGYKVRVNEGAEIVVDNGENHAAIAFTKSGENKIEVCFYDPTLKSYSAWVATIVTAYAIEFDTLVADTSFPTQYKAAGDSTDSFDGSSLKKSGHTFYGWYKSAEVGNGNAVLYTDGYFRGASDLKLYADYTANKYSLAYNYAGGTGKEKNVDVTFGKEFKMTVPTISDPTKSFGGWYSAPDGTGIRLTDEYGDSVQPWAIAVEETGGDTMSVYAHWKLDTLEFSEGKLPGGKQTVFKVRAGKKINLVSEVTIPETYMGVPVKIIEANGFKDCAKLKKINIPNTLELIYTDPSPFSGCTSLQEINVTEVENNKMIRYWSQDGVLFDMGKIDERDPSETVDSELAIFPIGYTQKSYRVPNGVATIAYQSFKSCKLEEVVFSTSVTCVEEDAFLGCTALRTVTFEDPKDDKETVSPLTIERRAFRNCTYLETVNFPARLKSINITRYVKSGKAVVAPFYENITYSDASNVTDSFLNCTQLKAINVAEGGQDYSSKDGVLFNANQTILYYAPRYFQKDDGKYTIPSTVREIANGAFLYCFNNFTEVTIPSRVTKIGEYAFYYAYNLQKVTFGGNGLSDVEIGKYAFRSAYNIRKIVFEAGSQVTKIGMGAFYTNYYGETVEIPATVKEIGDHAFGAWSKLKEVTIQETTADGASLEFGDQVFYNAMITSLTLPTQVTKVGGVLSGLSRLREVHISKNSNNYMSDEYGVLFNKNAAGEPAEIIYYPSMKDDETYTLPSTVTKIGAGVFSNNSKLKSFTVPANVTEIGDNAFNKCMVRTIVFEDGTAPLTIGANVFRDCDALTSLVLPDRVVEIGSYSLSYMDKLETLTLNEGLTEISSYGVYQNPKLKKLVVPSTVKTIGYYGVAYNAILSEIVFAKDKDGNSSLEEILYYGIYMNTKISSIEFPKSLKRFAYYALYAGNSSELSSVTFEKGSRLEEIGPYAFYCAKKLKTITIPNSVKYIYGYAFASSGLTEILFEDGGTADLRVGSYCVYQTSPTSSKSVNYGYVFRNTRIKSVEFPARLVELGAGCFSEVTALKTVTFAPEGQTSRLNQIGEYCFNKCTSLQSIKLPKSLKNLPVLDEHPSYAGKNNNAYMYDRPAVAQYAFAYCSSLSSVIFEEGGTDDVTIASYAFYYCTSLEKIDLPARLSVYEDEFKKVMLPLGYANTFANCTNLKEINIVGTPTANNLYVSKDGIVYTTDMTTIVLCPNGREKAVVIANTVSNIGDSEYALAFNGCAKLTSITFESGNDELDLTIGASAFGGCNGLTTISLPKRVVTVDDGAFENCVNLQSVELSADLAVVNGTAFAGCVSLVAVNVTENERYVSVNGVLFSPDMETLYYYPASKDAESYTVPQGVKTIGKYAFYCNTTLKEIVLPSSVLAIDSYSFYGCEELAKINIPKNVASIGDYAFYHCGKLAQLTFDEGGSAPLAIGDVDWLGLTQYSGTYNYGYAFAYCYSLTEVVLPERTKTVSDNAFAYCGGLKKVTIPASAEMLGTGIFYYCERLETVKFAEGIELESIPAYAFYYCYSLKEITIPASVTEFAVRAGATSANPYAYTFYHCEGMTNVYFEEGCSITAFPSYAFGYCTSLDEIELPASFVEIKSNTYPFANCEALRKVTFAGDQVKTIGNYAFRYCYGLESIEIPESVKTIGQYAFAFCYALDNVVIPEDATIGTYLFYYCVGLKNVTLPSSLEKIPDYTFANCASLANFDLSDNVTSFGKNVFAGTGLTSFTVPEAIKELPNYTFYQCYELESVTLHDEITKIGNYTFAYCYKLDSMVLPNSVESLGTGVFYRCEGLKSAVLPENNNMTTVPASTFCYCLNLESFTIPSCYTYIDSNAFSYCEKLTSVVIPARVTDIASYAFNGCSLLASVTLPDALQTITASSFKDCTSLARIDIPENVTTIANYAFSNCASLAEVTLPNGLMSLGANAFSFTAIEEIKLPEMLFDLGNYVFVGCENLTKIEVDKNNASFKITDGVLTDLNEMMIYMILPSKTGTFTLGENQKMAGGALALSNISTFVLPSSIAIIDSYMFYQAKSLTTVVIPEGVELIDSYAFADSGITEIVIPASVVNLGLYAFSNCADLTSVTFASGNKQLKIGTGAFQFCTALESVVIPHRVRAIYGAEEYAIASYAFKGCTSLKSVVFEETPEENGIEDGVLNIQSEVFRDCTALERVDLPAAFGDGGGSYYAFGVYTFSGCTSLHTVTFKPVRGRSIYISNYVFKDCTSLSNFEFPSTTIYIGAYAFAETALKTVVIPESVTNFGSATESESILGVYRSTSYNRAFYNCKELTTVTIKSDSLKLTGTSYTNNMFEGCTALETVDIQGDGFTMFGDKMFLGCTALKNFTIPASVTKMGRYVFEGVNNNTTINANRSEGETNQWTVFWNQNSNANFVYTK